MQSRLAFDCMLQSLNASALINGVKAPRPTAATAFAIIHLLVLIPSFVVYLLGLIYINCVNRKPAQVVATGPATQFATY